MIIYTNLQYTKILRKLKGSSGCISSNSEFCELLKMLWAKQYILFKLLDSYKVRKSDEEDSDQMPQRKTNKFANES